MTDKFKMVRYDINGEVKNGPLSIWGLSLIHI